MDSNAAAKPVYPADDGVRCDNSWAVVSPAAEEVARVSGRVSFLTVLLLSAALWAAIWAAIASLASASG